MKFGQKLEAAHHLIGLIVPNSYNFRPPTTKPRPSGEILCSSPIPAAAAAIVNADRSTSAAPAARGSSFSAAIEVDAERPQFEPSSRR